MGRYEKSHGWQNTMIPPLIDLAHKTVIKDKESGKRGEGLGRSYEESDRRAWKKLQEKLEEK